MGNQQRINDADMIDVSASKVTEVGDKTWFLKRDAGDTSEHPRFNDSGNPAIYGIDAFGFNALPAGLKDYNHDYFGEKAVFYTVGLVTKIISFNDNIVVSDSFSYGLETGRSIRAFRPATSEELNYNDGQIIQSCHTDYDGNIYDGVKIGTQVWLNRNYESTHLANGTVIPTNISNDDWIVIETLGYYTPNENGYGLLYNESATVGLINDGEWKIPTSAEFDILIDYIISLPNYDNTNVGSSLKSIRQINSIFVTDLLKPIDDYFIDAKYLKNLPIQDLTDFVKKVTGYDLVATSEIAKIHTQGTDEVSEFIAMSNNGADAKDLSVGVKYTFPMTNAQIWHDVFAVLQDAPTGQSLRVDIKKNGTSIFSTLLSIDAGEVSSITASIPKVFTSTTISWAIGDVCELSIERIGTINTGKGLIINIIKTNTL